MRISDWSSDVCSSDLHTPLAVPIRSAREFRTMLDRRSIIAGGTASFLCAAGLRAQVLPPQGFATPSGTVPFAPDVFRDRDRKGVVVGRSVVVRVALGGRRSIKKKKTTTTTNEY